MATALDLYERVFLASIQRIGAHRNAWKALRDRAAKEDLTVDDFASTWANCLNVFIGDFDKFVEVWMPGLGGGTVDDDDDTREPPDGRQRATTAAKTRNVAPNSTPETELLVVEIEEDTNAETAAGFADAPDREDMALVAPPLVGTGGVRKQFPDVSAHIEDGKLIVYVRDLRGSGTDDKDPSTSGVYVGTLFDNLIPVATVVLTISKPS
jgi:hypothetical protein